MDIAEPQVLARLPRPLQGIGNVRFGPVWGMRNGVKRKRQETCAAVDGNSINIYEVRSGKNVISYAIPPTSIIAGPPCSVRRKENGVALRQTYCALKQDELEIYTYKTEEQNLHSHSSQRLCTLEHQESPVVQLDVIQDDDHDVILVVQENGDLTQCMSNNGLSAVRYLKSESRQQGTVKILAAAVVTGQTAKATILKARSDIADNLDERTTILAGVYTRELEGGKLPETASDLYYGLWSFANPPQGQTLSSFDLHPIVEHRLPMQEPLSMEQKHPVSFLWSPPMISIRNSQSLISFDISGTVPRKLSMLRSALLDCEDVLVISPYYLAAAFSDSVRVLDTTYEVEQVRFNLNQTSLKRKRDKSTTTSSKGEVELIAYFSQLGRCLCKRRSQLISLDVKFQPTGPSKRAVLTRSSLAHSITRGMISEQSLSEPTNTKRMTSSIGQICWPQNSFGKWPSVRRNLEHLLSSNNVGEFEKIFLQEIKDSYAKSFDGTTLHSATLVSPSNIGDVRIDFILSTIFSHDRQTSNLEREDTTNSLVRLKINATKILKFLIHNGLLTWKRLCRAFRHSSALFSGDGLAVDSIARALYDADTSASLLLIYAQNNRSPDIEEHAAITKYLIELALAQSSSSSGQLLLIDKQPDDGSPAVQNGTETTSQSSSTYAALSSNIHRALVCSLETFGRMAPSSISTLLRSRFSRTEVIAIIQFIRQQLFRGGHIGLTQAQSSETRLITHPDELGDRKQDIHSISFDSMVKILSGCLDTLGVMGLFGPGENEDFIESIIPDLSSEISRAAKDIEDSSDLQGILRETLRYAESKNVKSGKNSTATSQEDQTHPKPGQIITVYSEGTEHDLVNGSRGALPLSLRAETINPIKIRTGGGQISKRSRRETRMLESRFKGSYSYEQLIL